MTLLEKAEKLANGVRILKEWIGSGAQTVSAAQAQHRADICIKCPKNNLNRSILTQAVAKAIKDQVKIKNALALRVNGEKSLGQCAVCLCENRLKIWLPIDRVRPEPGERDQFPDGCWLKKETA